MPTFDYISDINYFIYKPLNLWKGFTAAVKFQALRQLNTKGKTNLLTAHWHYPSSPSYFTADHTKPNGYCNALLGHFLAFKHNQCLKCSQLQNIFKLPPDMLLNDDEKQRKTDW